MKPRDDAMPRRISFFEASQEVGATRRSRTGDLLITKWESHNRIYDFMRRDWPGGESRASAKRLSLVGNQCAYQRSVVLGSE